MNNPQEYQYVVCQINGCVTPVRMCKNCYHLNEYKEAGKNNVMIDCGHGLTQVKRISRSYDQRKNTEDKQLNQLYTNQFSATTECELCHKTGSYASYGGTPKPISVIGRHISGNPVCSECRKKMRVKSMRAIIFNE